MLTEWGVNLRYDGGKVVSSYRRYRQDREGKIWVLEPLSIPSSSPMSTRSWHMGVQSNIMYITKVWMGSQNG